MGLRDRVSEGKGDLGEIKKKNKNFGYLICYLCVFIIYYIRGQFSFFLKVKKCIDK